MYGSTRLFALRNELLEKLFAHEDAHFQRQALALIPKNFALGGSQDGFRHLGVIYTEITGSGRRKGSFPPLHPTLVPEMQTLLEDKERVEAERNQVGQALTLVLRDCRSHQDMRDALPNGMKDMLPACADLPRTRPEGFTLEGNDRLMRQYGKLREKVEFYLASKLLY